MTIYNVSNASQLSAAISNAQGGDTIVLASGNYGELNLSSKFGSTVTITSADPSAPATFSSVQINNAQNVTFDNLLFDYTYSNGDPDYLQPFSIRNSSDIAVRNTEISGDDDNTGYGTAWGLTVIDSNNIDIQNNEVHNFHRGVKVLQSTDVKVLDNDVHSISGDGMNFADVQRVLIENNYIHDFDSDPNSPFHKDMLQFWTTGTDSPSTDIVIRGNTLDIGSGAWTQSIFMRNELVDQGQAGREMYYKNILIEDNTIYNAHVHGITVGETDNLAIRNNTILQADGDLSNGNNAGRSGSIMTPRIIVSENSNTVTITDNITYEVGGYTGQGSWNVDGNVLVQYTSPSSANYVGSLLESTAGLQGGGAHSATAAVGGVIDQTNAGASKVQPEYDGGQSGGGGSQSGGDDQSGGGDQSDGGGEQSGGGDNGGDDESGGDTTPPPNGDYSVTLFDMSNRPDFLQDNAKYINKKLQLDGDKDYANIGRIEELEDSGQIAFSITYNRTTIDNGSERLLWNHMKFGLTLDGGDLVVHVANEERPFWEGFKVKGLGLDDLEQHQIKVFADQDTDVLKVYVDGKLVLDESGYNLNFVDAGGGEWGWTISTAWDSFFEGEVSDFGIGTKFGADDGQTGGGDTSGDDGQSGGDDDQTDGDDQGSDDDGPVVADGIVVDDHVIDFGALIGDNYALGGDAHVIDNGDGVRLDGNGDSAYLGRFEEFENSDQLTFAIDYNRNSVDGDTERLVWNHMKFGVALEGDGLSIHVANKNQPFWQGIKVENLGLDDKDHHKITVMADADTDHLQVFVDDQLVLDRTDLDIDFVGAGGGEWGWSIGTAWDRFFDGDVTGFALESDAQFVETSVPEAELLA